MNDTFDNKNDLVNLPVQMGFFIGFFTRTGEQLEKYGPLIEQQLTPPEYKIYKEVHGGINQMIDLFTYKAQVENGNFSVPPATMTHQQPARVTFGNLDSNPTEGIYFSQEANGDAVEGLVEKKPKARVKK